jgi:tRNA threonylcarbamoyladenosine biosynthesis protein TsaB
LNNFGFVIGIETSTDLASVAIGSHANAIEHTTIEGHAQHSQLLLPTLQSMIAAQAFDGMNCRAIAVDIGPGGFTGLRTACGIAQGLATGWNAPCACYSSLELIGLQGRQNSTHLNAKAVTTQRWLCCIDARLNECYWAVYDIILIQTPYGPIAKTAATLVAPCLTQTMNILAKNTELQNTLHGLAVSGFSIEQISKHVGFLGTVNNRPLEICIAPPCAFTLVQQTLLRLDIENNNTLLTNAAHCQPLYLRENVAQTTAQRLAEKHGQPNH